MGINIKEKDRILVVAPHPDDESIGCGGLLAIYAKQCDVLVITDGDNKTIPNLADIREQELKCALDLANVSRVQCLRIPEHHIKEHVKRIKDFGFENYDHVFVPNRYDAHKDHVIVYRIIKKFLSKNSKLYEYEVWSPLRKPNIYLDITDVEKRKTAMINCHESQVKVIDYVGMIMGLNAYRGRGHGYPYAECYYCKFERMQEIKRRIKRKGLGMIYNLQYRGVNK